MANIVLADSNNINVELINVHLSTGSHKLRVANSTDALMKLLKVKQPDVIIIGIKLENEDGRQVVQALKQDKAFKHIPVVLTSPFYHTSKEISKFGCNSFVSMPADCSQLNQLITELLQQKKGVKTFIQINDISLN